MRLSKQRLEIHVRTYEILIFINRSCKKKKIGIANHGQWLLLIER